jgi:hypothetical protein
MCTTWLEVRALCDLLARASGFIQFQPKKLFYTPLPTLTARAKWSVAQVVPLFPHPSEADTFLYNHRIHWAWVDRFLTTLQDDLPQAEGAHDKEDDHTEAHNKNKGEEEQAGDENEDENEAEQADEEGYV